MDLDTTIHHTPAVTRRQREAQNGHRGAVVWFTGLSGAGKTTLAQAVEARLYQAGSHAFVLDGDVLRQGLCVDLGFSAQDRSENIRRAGEAAGLLAEAGIIVLAAFISPFHADRARLRERLKTGNYFEVYCDCPLEVCERRDVKGLYRRARAGEIRDFTAISSPYEAPRQPDLVLETGRLPLDSCTEQVLAMLHSQKVIGSASAR